MPPEKACKKIMNIIKAKKKDDKNLCDGICTMYLLYAIFFWCEKWDNQAKHQIFLHFFQHVRKWAIPRGSHYALAKGF